MKVHETALTGLATIVEKNLHFFKKCLLLLAHTVPVAKSKLKKKLKRRFRSNFLSIETNLTKTNNFPTDQGAALRYRAFTYLLTRRKQRESSVVDP